MAKAPWSCAWARTVVASTGSLLQQFGVAKPWIPPESVGTVLTACASCRGSGNVRACHGWRLQFGGPTALRLLPVDVGGRLVEVVLDGVFDYTASAPRRNDWAAPLRECTAAVRILAAGTDYLLARQHVDLANAGQPGPVWHLQSGGVPGFGAPKGELTWLKVPRWPVPPVDFVLVVELLVYTFANAKWLQLRQTRPWRDYVKEAEALVLAGYRDHLNAYLNQDAFADSWLTAQCNIAGRWQPRPK
jgi:hypothetical protein